MEELEKNETSTQAEENTVSLASAQALADALAKIEAYTPTTWVDNSSPDIDAEHLNKPEQAIKRVTDALNSAVDVIKNLQSQVTKNAGDISTVNNNLSNSLQYVHTTKNPFDFNDVNTPAGFHRVNDSDSFKNPPLEIQNNANINYGNIFVCKSNENSDTLSMTFYPYDQNTIFIKTANFTSWEGKGWTQLVSKSDSLRFSRTYMSGDSYADAKNLSIPPGIYSVDPNYKNIPETTYGFLEIVADSINNWRLIKFIPTNIKSYYLMFYNGYDKTWSGWAHFTSVP